MYAQKVIITFRDSYILFGAKLRDLPGMFGINALEKEIFPYESYTPEQYRINKCSISEACKHIGSSTRE